MAKKGKFTSIDEVKYFSKTGVVLDAQNSATTHVHGGGGQNNTPVSISSTTTKHLHIFVRQDNGKEFDTTFDNLGVAVRPGHRVSVVYVGAKNESVGYSTGMLVHDTGRSAVCTTTAESFVQRTNPAVGCLSVVFAPMLFAAAFVVLTGGSSFSSFVGIVGVGAVAYWLYSRKSQSDKLRAQIVDGVEAELEKLRQTRGD